MDWKTPFEIAFQLGMAAIGWCLVLIIVFLIFAVSAAAITAILKSFRKKKDQESLKKTLLRVVKERKGE